MSYASGFWRLLDPWILKARSRLEHLEERHPSTRHYRELARYADFPSTVHLAPSARIINAGERAAVSIGEYSSIQGEILVIAPARIRLGSFCTLGVGSRIWATKSVSIGNYVLIAHLVDIHDSNSHSLDWRQRRRDPEAVIRDRRPMDVTQADSVPVTIEDDVWIGFKSTILKGVTIGRGAVVAAASVVTKDVPPFTLVAGNPARAIRALKES